MEEFLLAVWAVVFWIVVIALWVRRRRQGVPVSVPVPLIGVMALYGWWRIEPMLAWIIYSRNSKRIARFLQRADDLRMRQQRVDGLLTRGPAR